MSEMNRLSIAKNPFQGKYRKVLCVCSGGILRSPTAAMVLSQPPFNYNTRAAGTITEFALIPVDRALVEWADSAVVMEERHKIKLLELEFKKEIIVLDIPDRYEYRDPELVDLIAKRYSEMSGSSGMYSVWKEMNP